MKGLQVYEGSLMKVLQVYVGSLMKGLQVYVGSLMKGLQVYVGSLMKGLQVYRLVDEGAPGIGSFLSKNQWGKSRGIVYSTLIIFAWSGKRGGNTYNEPVKRKNVESRNVCEKIIIFTL